MSLLHRLYTLWMTTSECKLREAVKIIGLIKRMGGSTTLKLSGEERCDRALNFFAKNSA